MISMVMWEHPNPGVSKGSGDNKNRVLSLRSEKRFNRESVVSNARKIGGSNPPLGTIQTKYDSIWIILTNKI